MKRVLRSLAVVGVLGLMAGCEWESTNDADAWNSRFNWVDFTGVYRPAAGGAIVKSYTVTPGQEAREIVVKNEHIATGVAAQTFYSGVLKKRPVIAGSVSINAGGFGFIDDSAGALAASGGRTGTINYDTGAWTIDLIVDIPEGSVITATYLYSVEGTASSVKPGGSGAVYALLVEQEGNLLKFTDSSGDVFTGRFGDMRTTAGDQFNTATEGTFVGNFEVDGTAFKKNVKIVGIFQGSMVTASPNVLFDRQMQATWVEEGGKTGDILAAAPNINVYQPQPQYDTTTSTNAVPIVP